MDKFIPQKQINPAYANLFNIWREDVLRIQVGEEVYFGSLEPCAPQSLLWGTLHFLWNEQAVDFGLDVNFDLQWLDPQLADVHYNDCDEELQKCLMQSFGETLAKNLTALKNGTWTFQCAESNLQIDTFAVIRFKNQAGQNIFSLFLNPGQIELFFKMYFKPSNKLPIKKLGVPFKIERGYVGLTLNELKALRLGDILLAANREDAQASVLRFSTPNFSFLAQLQNNTFTITQLLMDKTDNLDSEIVSEEEQEDSNEVDSSEESYDEIPEGVMADDSPEEEDSDYDDVNDEEVGEHQEEVAENVEKQDPATVNINKFPVKVTFDAGSKIISIDDLKQLKVGYTFDLDHSVDDDIKIYANGQWIGNGEWVKLNEHLGVRITQLN